MEQAMGAYRAPMLCIPQPLPPLRGSALRLDVERGRDEGGAETESDNCSENELPHLSLCAGVLHWQFSARSNPVSTY